MVMGLQPFQNVGKLPTVISYCTASLLLWVILPIMWLPCHLISVSLTYLYMKNAKSKLHICFKPAGMTSKTGPVKDGNDVQIAVDLDNEGTCKGRFSATTDGGSLSL